MSPSSPSSFRELLTVSGFPFLLFYGPAAVAAAVNLLVLVALGGTEVSASSCCCVRPVYRQLPLPDLTPHTSLADTL